MTVRALVCVLVLCGVGIVEALDEVQFDAERIVASGWRLEGIQVTLGAFERDASRSRVGGLSLSARLRIARAELADGYRLSDIRIDCPALQWHGSEVNCGQAAMTFTAPALGAQRFAGRVSYDRASGDIELDVRGAPMADARLHVRASLRMQDWQLEAQVENLQLEPALALAAEMQVDLPPVSAAGRFTGTLAAAGAQRLERLVVTASPLQLTANNPSGTLASDALSVTGRVALERAGEEWDVDLALQAQEGQAYAEPVFIDFGMHGLAARAQGRVFADRRIELRHFDIEHREAMHAEGSAHLDLTLEQPLRDLDLTLHWLQFPGAYAVYLQPFLLNTDFKSLTTSGRLTGTLRIEHGAPRTLMLELEQVGLDDGSRKFVMQGMDGVLDWRDGADAPAEEGVVLRSDTASSWLRWRAGSVLNLALGAGELQFATIGRNFRLVQPARIGLLDGALELASLRVRNIGLPSVAFMVDATLQPISVAEVCRAFGWPQFGGTLGGTISKLRLREGVLTLGTVLQAEVFDGRVAIRDLRLEEPFGDWPRLYSSIALEDLDLELVTRAFSFGRITGRLSGEIADLRLFNWQPIAFDARLYTPENDRSRHRISQRAVQDIGSIGGGGAGVAQALSSGFLRFFDDFGYRRLGISCRLENEVCHMDGVAPAPHGGYYLVQGAGLPRIDVIGNARRVDWSRLVRQLAAMSESEGPVVR